MNEEYEEFKIYHCSNVEKCWHCKYDKNCKEYTARAIKEFMVRNYKKEGNDE